MRFRANDRDSYSIGGSRRLPKHLHSSAHEYQDGKSHLSSKDPIEHEIDPEVEQREHVAQEERNGAQKRQLIVDHQVEIHDDTCHVVVVVEHGRYDERGVEDEEGGVREPDGESEEVLATRVRIDRSTGPLAHAVDVEE